MDYRLATETDIPALGDMRWAFRAESGEVPLEGEDAFRTRYVAFLREGLRSGVWTYWVADDAGVLAACMAVHVVQGVPRPARASDQWGYLTDCYTEPSYRGAGVGTALMAIVRAWSEAQDLELLLVWPSEASATFYERAGFRAPEGLAVLTLRESMHHPLPDQS